MMDAHSLLEKERTCHSKNSNHAAGALILLHRHNPTNRIQNNLVAHPNPPSFPTCVVILMVRGNWQKRVETAQG
jgi:hypothetical protein